MAEDFDRCERKIIKNGDKIVTGLLDSFPAREFAEVEASPSGFNE